MLTRQSLGLIAEYTVNTVITTALIFLALRHFSPQEMGVLAKIQAEVGLLSVLLTLCLDTPLLNRLADSDKRGRLLGATLLLRTGATLVTLVLAVGLAAWAGQEPAEALPWLVVVLLPQAMSTLNVFGIMLYYDNRMGWVSRMRIGVSLVFAGVRLACLYLFQVSLLSYALLTAIEGALGLTLTWWCYRGHRYDIKIWPCLETAKTLLREAAPLILSSFVVTCFFKLDLLLVARLMPAAIVAEYSVAQRIVECYLVVLVILLNQYYVWLTAQEPQARLRGIANMSRVGLGLGACVAGGHLLVVEPALLWFFHGKYRLGIELSGFLLLSLAFSMLGTIRGYLFVFEQQNNWHIPSALLGVAALLVGTQWATMHYGLYGAAAVLVCGQALSVVGSTLLFRPLRPYFPLLIGIVPHGRAR